MPKIWLPSEAECEDIHSLMNEDLWFSVHQDLLLWMVNTRAGRDIFCIPQEYPLIVKITKNSVHFLLEYHGDGRPALLAADFRVGAKWANVVRYRWMQFNAMARYFATRIPENIHLSAMTRFARSVCVDTLTSYPDPHPETTTVDGYVYTHGSSTWASAHAATNGEVATDDGVDLIAGTSSVFYILRSFILFDTSSLTSGATISAGVVSLYAKTNNNLDNDANAWTNIYQSNPASNTSLSLADFDQCGDAVTNPTKGASDVALSGQSINNYIDHTLTATGRGWIDKTGVTKLGIREGHDAVDDAPNITGSQEQDMYYASADTANTTSDPKLTVTYTVVSFILPQIERTMPRGIGRGIMRP